MKDLDRMKLRTDNSMFTSGLHDESIISLVNETNHEHDGIIKMINKYDGIIRVNMILIIMQKILMVIIIPVLLSVIVIFACTLGFADDGQIYGIMTASYVSMILLLIVCALLVIMQLLQVFIIDLLMMGLFPGRASFTDVNRATRVSMLFIDKYYSDGHDKSIARRNHYACRKACALIAYAYHDGVNLLHIDSKSYDKLIAMFLDDYYFNNLSMSDKHVYNDVMSIIFEMIDAGRNNAGMIDSEPYLDRINQTIMVNEKVNDVISNASGHDGTLW